MGGTCRESHLLKSTHFPSQLKDANAENCLHGLRRPCNSLLMSQLLKLLPYAAHLA